MADDEIGVRLTLKDRARFSSEANRAEADIKKIGTAAEESDKKARKSSGGFGVFGKAIGAIGTAVKIGGVALAAGAGLAVVAGKKMLDLATDAFESQQKYATVFGDLKPQVDSFIKTINQKYGFPTKDLQDFTSAFAVFGKSADVPRDQLAKFSTDLVQAGIDMSSFWNVPQTDVFQAIQSGLVGMSRPLRQFGIFLSETAVQTKAMEMGLGGGAAAAGKAKIANEAMAIAQAKARDAIKKYGADSQQAASANLAVEKSQAAIDKVAGDTKIKLTDQQKVMVRQKLILEQLGDAQGDLARTSGSMQNQMRGFKGRVQELETTIGLALLPTAARFVTFLNHQLSPAIGYLKDHGSEWAQKIGDAASHMGDKAAEAVKAFQSGGFSGFARSIDDSAGAHGRLADAMEHAKNIAKDLADIAEKSVFPALKDIAGVVTPVFVGTFEHLDVVTGFLADHTTALKRAIELVVGVMVLERGLAITSAIAQGALTTVRVVAALVTGGYTAAVGAAAAAEATEAVAAGVLAGVLESQTVSLGVAAGAWLLNTANMAIDTAGRYAWLGASIVTGAVEEIVSLGSLAAAWVVSTAATWANQAASLAWKAVGMGAMLFDLGVQLVVAAAKQVAYGVALAATTVASYAARGAALAWAAAQWVLNAAMDANPIGLVVIAIAALVGVFILAWKHSTLFREIVTGAFHAVASAVGWVVGFIKDHWQLLLTILLGPVGLAIGFIITHFHTIMDFIGGVIGWVRDHWQLVLMIITGPIGIAVGMVVTHFAAIRDFIGGVVDWVRGKWDDFFGFFTGLPGNIASIASTMWDGIKDAFRGVINWIIRAWNGLHFKVPSFDTHIPGVGTVGGFDLGVPQIPELHQGGTVVAGGAVNMRPDEEIIVLPPAASVIPLDNTETYDNTTRRPPGEPKIIQLKVDRRTLAEVMIDGAGDIVARK